MKLLIIISNNINHYYTTKQFKRITISKILSFIFSYLLVTLSNCIYAQNNSSSFALTGVVKQANNSPIADVVVTLLNTKQQTVFRTTFTDEAGHFEFLNLSSDSFQLAITHIGFKNYVSTTLLVGKDSLLSNPFTIILQADNKTLDEVTVTTKIPFVERKLDRTIINPDALISNSSGSALDALSKAPGIMIDENGNIKLKGKTGVLVLIDDKPTYLSGNQLEAYLKSLPSSVIKQIEIMVNPPAQYDAAGSAGVINIKLKRNRLKGINGAVNGGYGQGRYGRTNDNLNLNFNSKKISVFSNLSYGWNNGYHDLYINRRYKNQDLSTKSLFQQNTYIRNNSEAFNAQLGLDYYITDKTTIGFMGKGSSVTEKVGRYNYARFLNADESLGSIVIADNTEKTSSENITLNLNLRHQFDSTGHQFAVDADYVTYTNRIQQLYKNDVFLSDGSNAYTDIQTGALPSKIEIYAFKTDYTLPFKNQSKFETGLKTSYTKTDNNAIYDITQLGLTIPNYTLSNRFLYAEMINAAYVNYSAGFKRFQYQLGLRFESTTLNGTQLGNPTRLGSTFNRDYQSIFPTAYASYQLDSAGKHTLVASYGRRINRPYYQDLNPFSSPLDKYTYYEGNPFLRPTFENNVSLAYTLSEWFTFTAYYSKSINQIQETIEIKDGIYYSRPGNIGFNQIMSGTLESSIPIGKWLTINAYSEVIYAQYKSKLYTEILDVNGTFWVFNCNNSFQLKKGFSAELSGEYVTNFLDSQFSFGDYGFVTIGLQKKILKDMGSIRLNLRDIFFTNRIRGTINNLYLTDANWYGPRDTRVIGFAFSYRFGKNTSKKEKYNAGGSEAEQNRVK